MKATALIVVVCISTLLALNPPAEKEGGKVEQGLQISPVPVKLTSLNRSRVGRGSYLVNAASGCANCHTCPTFLTGPDSGKAKQQINALNYMAGGVPFALPEDAQGPSRTVLKSANATP